MSYDSTFNGVDHRTIHAWLHSGPGSAPTTTAMADQWRAVGVKFMAVAGLVDQAVRAAGGEWSGAAAEAAVDGMSPLAGYGRSAADVTEQIADRVAQQSAYFDEAKYGVPDAVATPGEPLHRTATPWSVDVAAAEAAERAADEEARRRMRVYQANTASNVADLPVYQPPPGRSVAVGGGGYDGTAIGEVGSDVPTGGAATPGGWDQGGQGRAPSEAVGPVPEVREPGRSGGGDAGTGAGGGGGAVDPVRPAPGGHVPTSPSGQPPAPPAPTSPSQLPSSGADPAEPAGRQGGGDPGRGSLPDPAGGGRSGGPVPVSGGPLPGPAGRGTTGAGERGAGPLAGGAGREGAPRVRSGFGGVPGGQGFLSENAALRRGAGSPGARGMGMMPMTPVGGRREEDREHRSPDYLVETNNIYGEPDMIAPPVVGAPREERAR